jgi:hypothetical protein
MVIARYVYYLYIPILFKLMISIVDKIRDGYYYVLSIMWVTCHLAIDMSFFSLFFGSQFIDLHVSRVTSR